MVVYDVFSVNETYTKTESDNRYPFKGNNFIIRTNGQTISADITISSGQPTDYQWWHYNTVSNSHC